MSCVRVRGRFSEHRDRALGAADAGLVTAHLKECRPCTTAWNAFNEDLDLLADVPRLPATGEVAARVFDRLDMERRQPGLSLVFRPFGTARPLILPSLVPAAVVLVTILSGALALDRPEPLPPVRTAYRAEAAAVASPASPESDPLFSMAEVSPPRVRSSDGVPLYLLDHPGQDTLFVEAVVATDGSVSAVTVIGGDSKLARHVVDAMRRERYEPARFRGRPVAVSIYRLISRMEVWGT